MVFCNGIAFQQDFTGEPITFITSTNSSIQCEQIRVIITQQQTNIGGKQAKEDKTK